MSYSTVVDADYFFPQPPTDTWQSNRASTSGMRHQENLYFFLAGAKRAIYYVFYFQNILFSASCKS